MKPSHSSQKKPDFKSRDAYPVVGANRHACCGLFGKLRVGECHCSAVAQLFFVSQGGNDGLHLLVAYEPYDEPDVTAKILRWMIVGVDADWNKVAVDPGGKALGPFVVGQVVRVRTKVTDARGSREGGERQLTVLQPLV